MSVTNKEVSNTYQTKSREELTVVWAFPVRG